MIFNLKKAEKLKSVCPLKVFDIEEVGSQFYFFKKKNQKMII